MKVLIVEDDLALSDVVSFTLRRAGFAVIKAYDGRVALESYLAERPDLVLLDLNLPKLDGLEVCRRIRALDQTPIIMLSARSDDEDVVKGLELGADDYIVKPFSPSQLVARVRAVLRRAGAVETPDSLQTADLRLDRERSEVQRSNLPPIRLTQLEMRLLEAFMLNAGQVLPSDRLISTVWGIDGGDRTMLKQLVYRLRAKLEHGAAHAVYIETVPSIGYVLTPARKTE